MSVIMAGELKRKGVSALAPALKEDEEVLITVRGRPRYVVVTLDKYNRLRESELAQAVREARADYKAGRIEDETVTGHMRRLRNEI
ncbi:MAG: type II toxin-antitoxin system prevent-host-death family antitoxin [Kiritimatiellae bacterium]|nr:type II toxin-antitoxin system prevent-host-death family antitoxin [Kiritimatiellia bacterium]